MSECNHDCASCASKKDGSCDGEKPAGFAAPANARSHVARVIAVMSGKGGVGKSLVTELLAVQAQKRGLRVAVLDADITGPSIPTAFGVKDRATSDGAGILPCRSESGIALMSLNFLVENPADPVVWRGPVIAGAVKQFWSDVAWGDVDVMFVDLPPGTGDVPLTVFQSLPVTGAVVVTSPQDLVSLIVEKAVRMAGMMDVPVLAAARTAARNTASSGRAVRANSRPATASPPSRRCRSTRNTPRPSTSAPSRSLTRRPLTSFSTPSSPSEHFGRGVRFIVKRRLKGLVKWTH